ncbi:MAG TPA: type II toxin-antitoxin system RatA family toxin [Devosiaceae bacterium]
MPRLRFVRHASHSPDRMLALVADVEQYPKFVPNCTAMQVWRDRASPETVYRARMHIRFGPIAQAYTSQVRIDPVARTITARAVDGPFSHLDSIWRFEPEETGTKVVFEIDFAFSNRLLAAAAEPAFAAKQEEILGAFLQRADQLSAGKA